MSRYSKTIKKHNKDHKRAVRKKVAQKSTAARLKKILEACINDYKPEDYAKRPGKDFTRNRKLPFKDLVMFLIAREGGSIAKSLIDWYPDPKKRMTASAVIQQEDKLNPDFMADLFDLFTSTCNVEAQTGSLPDKTMWGRRLFAFDGTTLQVALDEEADSYVNNSGPNHTSPGYNILHLNTLYDLLGCTFQTCTIDPQQKENEHRALIEIAEHFDMPRDSIVIADRGIGGFNVYEHLNRAGIDYVFRIKNNEYAEIRALPTGEVDRDVDFVITTKQTKKDRELVANGAHMLVGPSPYGKTKKTVSWDFEPRFTLTLRVVRFNIGPDDDPEYETLVTSLDRDEFPIDKMKELYNMRWGVETAFRELKYAIGLKSLHARREDFVRHEIYAKLIAYNFGEIVITNVIIDTVEGEKYAYMPDHKLAVHILMLFLRRENAPPDVEEQIAMNVVPIRPGRKDIRKDGRDPRGTIRRAESEKLKYAYRIAC